MESQPNGSLGFLLKPPAFEAVEDGGLPHTRLTHYADLEQRPVVMQLFSGPFNDSRNGIVFAEAAEWLSADRTRFVSEYLYAPFAEGMPTGEYHRRPRRRIISFVADWTLELHRTIL